MSRGAWIAVIVGVSVVVGVALFAGVAVATDQPQFCDSCHEMGPYYDAWSQGPHADVWCIDCHVEPGLPARFAHKFVALKEVWAHVTGDTTFPRENLTPIPSERCLNCHEDVESELEDGFDHQMHAQKGACVECHYQAGHAVTTQTLDAAGILNPDVERQRLRGELAAVGAGKANLKGHKPVACDSCHDMAATPCASCHEPPDSDEHPQVDDRACSQCHKPGEEFVFAHPTNPKDCTDCHSAPKDDHPRVSGACTQCHKYTGESWRFTHPGAKADCTDCHSAPKDDHPRVSGACTQCHKRAGKSWAFSHSSLGSNCASCHKAPGGKHPTSGSCSSCHRSGSWAFRHGSAGGEHSYRSFACSKCHPSSYSRVSCTCHGGGRPVDD